MMLLDKEVTQKIKPFGYALFLDDVFFRFAATPENWEGSSAKPLYIREDFIKLSESNESWKKAWETCNQERERLLNEKATAVNSHMASLKFNAETAAVQASLMNIFAAAKEQPDMSLELKNAVKHHMNLLMGMI